MSLCESSKLTRVEKPVYDYEDNTQETGLKASAQVDITKWNEEMLTRFERAKILFFIYSIWSIWLELL